MPHEDLSILFSSFTWKQSGVQTSEAGRNRPFQVIVREIYELRAPRLDVQNRAAEAIVIEPEFKKLRQAGERFGDRPREAVVGEVELLEPAHALEGSVGYLSGELVPRQVDRSQALQLAYRRHRAIEAVPHEAEGAERRRAAEKGELGEGSREGHVLEAEARDVAAEDAGPVGEVVVAGGGVGGISGFEGARGVRDGSLELEKDVGVRRACGGGGRGCEEERQRREEGEGTAMNPR